jgi:hypothetical protein
MKPKTNWAAKQPDLERLAAAGLRAWEIAERLGVTTNSVIGRASRTGVKLLDRVEAIRMTKAEQYGRPQHERDTNRTGA